MKHFTDITENTPHAASHRSSLQASFPTRVVALALALAATVIPLRALAQTDLDAETLYHRHTTPMTITATKSSTYHRPRGSNFHVQLEASGGYGAHVDLLGDHLTGPTISAAMLLTWGHGTQVGVRLGGSYGEMTGRKEAFWGRKAVDVETPMITAYAAVQASFRNGLWVAMGLGGHHTENFETKEMPFVPELVVPFGYRLALGRHVALQISGEAATFFFVNLRVSAQAGVVLRF